MGQWTIDQIVTGLHDLAEYIATHADLPYDRSDYGPVLELKSYTYGNQYGEDKPDLPAIARKMGKCDKDVSGSLFTVQRDFGGGAVRVSFSQSRESVCTKVQVGTKTRVIPEVKARPEEVKVEPEYEYSCPESLLRKGE